MKKLLLFVFLISSSLNLAQSVLVSGAGTEVVNGGYFVEGTYDGVNYYSNGSLFIYRLFGTYWRISTVLGSNMASDMYYTTYNTWSSVPWGRTYYPSVLGSSPAPTLQSYNVENLGSYTFSTQQEIDDFGASYPYNVYLENLYIGNSNQITDIHDLSPLQNIVGITGNLSILNTSLTNVDGLSGLEVAGGYIYIRFNHSLLNLNGLSNLKAINGYIEIRQNNVIEDISGLRNISPATIANNYGIQIVNNPQLSVCNLGNFCSYLSDEGHPREIYGNLNQCLDNEAVLTACANLCDVGDYTFHSQQDIDEFTLARIHCEALTFNNLTIEGNDITNIAVLDKTTHIEASLIIRNNSLLQSIPEFHQIENIGGSLIIQNNPLITNLESFGNLDAINGNLDISGNSQLQDISGLINLNPESISGTEGLTIQNNPQLSVCNLPNLCIYLSDPENPRIIEGNAAECVNEDALQLVCATCQPPFNLSVENISDTHADVSWQGSGNLFDIIFGPSGFTPGTEPTVAGVEDFPYQLIGLSANTEYDFYVRQDCSGYNQSEWSGPYTFTTRAACPIYLLTQTQEMVDEFGEVYAYCTHLQQLYLYGTATHLDGLSNLTSIGNIQTMGYHALGNFEGLNNVATVTGYIQITQSSVLENLTGFESLTSVGNRIEISSNPQLKSIDAFDNLSEMGTSIMLRNNTQLTDINGFENIDPSTISNLIIQNNSALSACNISNFCEYLTLPSSSYPRTISGNGTYCTSPSDVTAVCSPVIWTEEGAWSNISGPTAIHYAEVLGNLSVGTDTPDFESQNLTINPDASLTIESGHSVSVGKNIINLAEADAVVVENGANLIQISALSQNQGDITVHRDSDPMVRLDYTLWSSPIVGQNLFGFSPETVNGVTNYPGSTGRIYIYDGANGYVNPNPFTEESVMENGTGYLFRSPNNSSSTLPEIYEGSFIGTPFSGNLSVSTAAGSFNSIGNPYPSNIMLNDLFTANPGIHAVYFWNNNHSAGNNYATCTNGMGCVAAMGGGNTPNGVITTGQGFIVHTDAYSVSFDNSMRVNDSGVFFKVDELESHRFWLNLNGEHEEKFNQILIGYVSEATNEVDLQIDGKMFDYEGPALYSLINEVPFVIQGRTLPFESSDLIQLGFRTPESGKFKIALADFDGIFAEGNTTIFLKDKELGITHNLMESNYEFESVHGEFKERFEVVYETKETMGSAGFNPHLVQVYRNNENIVIESKTEKIISVELFDLNGRNLHKNEKINANLYQIKSRSFGTRVLVVKVQTQNGEVVKKKIINK